MQKESTECIVNNKSICWFTFLPTQTYESSQQSGFTQTRELQHLACYHHPQARCTQLALPPIWVTATAPEFSSSPRGESPWPRNIKATKWYFKGSQAFMPFEPKIFFVHAVTGGQSPDSSIIRHNRSIFTQTQVRHFPVLSTVET